MICGVAALNPSYISSHTQLDRQWKRRSADVGGLHLATGNSGQGKGWVGIQVETQYAELLSDMYNQTLNAVNEHSSVFVPTSLPKTARSRLIRSLDCWHFEPHKLPEEEILACTMILFEALYRIEGMEAAVGVSLEQISSFVHHLRQIYRYENTYHNFEHALDVLQATQCYLNTANMVPPVTILLESGRTWKSSRSSDDDSLIQTLGLRDLFALYIAAIGHDVGHPGVTNVFMKNAQTPLSLVFDGRSALEQLHCQLLLRVMRHHGLGALLDDPCEGTRFRKLLLQTVLATDMSVHADFMRRFQQELNGKRDGLFQRKILACQALLKNADISNPSRPFPVAQHWATALMQEWTAQADLEDHFCLQQSVQPSDDPLAGAKSQIFFISTFAKPLLDQSVKAVPEMARYAQHCDMNLERWVTRKAELESRNDPLPPNPSLFPRSPRQPSDFQSAFPLTLPTGSSNYLPTPSASVSADNSVASSDSDPTSPCESTHSSSAFFSPSSEVAVQSLNDYSLSGNHHRTPSSSGSSNGSSGVNTQATSPLSVSSHDGHEAIRAAGRLSIRQLKKPHRNSWCVTSPILNGGANQHHGFAFGLDASANTFVAPSPLSTVFSVSPQPSVVGATVPLPVPLGLNGLRPGRGQLTAMGTTGTGTTLPLPINISVNTVKMPAEVSGQS